MKYSTVSGDTFDIIAHQMYGDAKLAAYIIEANIEYADIIIFEANVQLEIPKIDTTTSINLPPWKRGMS